MFNHFARNRGPVRMPDAVGGPTDSAAQQSALGSSSGGMNSDMKSLFNQGMAQQEQMYAEGMQMSQQKDELQTYGDAALKTLKAIQIS